MAEAAFVQRCDRQLRSFALSMPGTERTAAREHSNKFKFICRPGFCQGEPEIWGWFIHPGMWRGGKQDESAIFNIVAELAGWKLLKSEQHYQSIFIPACKPSAVTLAGLQGKMTCYEMKAAETALFTVVAVVADAEVGFVVCFQSADLKNVQDFAVDSLGRFALERGQGDSTLERWFR